MIRIAICDDDSSSWVQLREILSHVENDLNENFSIKYYNDGVELYRVLTKGEEYDIIFLDVTMPYMDGIRVGDRIRNELKDEHIQIIYISTNTSCAVRLFKVRPTDLLLKPFEEQRVRDATMLAYKQLSNEKQVFSFECDWEIIRKPIIKILYFESSARKIILHSVNGSYEYYGNLNEVYQQLKPNRFFFIHKSFLVNYNHIEKITYDTVTLSNGTQLVISQSRRKEVRELYMKFEQL